MELNTQPTDITDIAHRDMMRSVLKEGRDIAGDQYQGQFDNLLWLLDEVDRFEVVRSAVLGILSDDTESAESRLQAIGTLFLEQEA